VLSREQAEEIQELASLFFFDDQIMTIMELDTLCPDAQRHIEIGRLKSEAELRKSIMIQAKAGSSPAQGMAVKFMETLKNKMY
jgi:hypothetical protein